MRAKTKKRFILVLFFGIIFAFACFIFFSPATILNFSINASPSPSPVPKMEKSPLSGLHCENAKGRPIAAMLGSDEIGRPLSGLAQADMVFEMPVISGGINRLMAVYLCEKPTEIGSIRSARHDFIPLAKGVDAILAHWGGSHFALDKLDNGVMDNLDALKNPSDAFWRKTGVVAPFNGFSSFLELENAAEKLGYRQSGKFEGYLHLENFSSAATSTKVLTVGYPGQFKVSYQYNPATNNYARFRNNLKEMDKNTKTQVFASNVVLMTAFSRQIEGQYNDVDVEGQGNAVVYRNGEEINGTWKKDAKNQTGKLFFYNEKGEEIKFAPGQIWVEVIEPGTGVTYE